MGRKHLISGKKQEEGQRILSLPAHTRKNVWDSSTATKLNFGISSGKSVFFVINFSRLCF